MPNTATSVSPEPEITVPAIRRLVHAFYGRVQEDPELGPIFDRIVGQRPGGWGPHLDKMVAFWSAVLLGIPGFDGNPLLAHRRIPDLASRHFERWLALWRVEAHRVFDVGPANEIIHRAERMAEHLQRTLLA